MPIRYLTAAAAAMLVAPALIAQTAVVRPQDQAAYESDMAAWRASVAQTATTNALNADLADKQQRAYADAMRAWRIQVIDCNRGIIAACRAPTPRPGDFMR